eukprot:m.83696 g.83696  ORF g.83696 m.83696 type:complete len:1062 (+) comp36367_c0_seq4:7-3192(+)
MTTAREEHQASRYSKFISRYPWAMLLIVAGLTAVCSVLDVKIVPVPSFEDPSKGFATRGTDIVKRIRTVDNIQNYTALTSADSLFNKLNDYYPIGGEVPTVVSSIRIGNGSSQSDALQLCTTTDFTVSARIVFEADFSLEKVRGMCNFSDDLIRSRANFSSICLKDVTENCCPDVSLGVIIAALRNLSSCNDVRQSDIDAVTELLTECAPWYGNDSLTKTCSERQRKYEKSGGSETTLPQGADRRCLSVPRKCVYYDAVYIILHYLVDTDFADAVISRRHPSASDFPSLTYAMTLYQTLDPSSRNPEGRRTPQDWFIDLYHDVLSKKYFSYSGVTVAGYSFSISFRIFSKRLLSEGIYPAMSLVIIFIIMWLYTRSFFITSMACLAIVFAIIIAYFLYHVIFRVPFFGFLNVMSFIVAIGVGADDVFVFVDVWRHTKATFPDAPLEQWVGTSLKHAALAMFVTSFTTATAFYSNAVSSITAIRVFGIFAGTVILMNYVMMITWLPAVVVIHEKYFDGLCHRGTRKVSVPSGLKKCYEGVGRVLGAIYGKVVPLIVIKFRYVLVVSLAALAIAASVAVLHKPRLRLPSDSDFQLFLPSEPLATYNLELMDRFYFERSVDPSENENVRLGYTFVWGVKAEDDGNHLDPDDVPVSLTFDSEWERGFSFTRQHQQYFIDFCDDVQTEDFYLFRKTCFASEMAHWLLELQDPDACAIHERLSRSNRWIVSQPYDLCCNLSLPTNSTVAFDTCLKRWANGLAVNRTTSDYFGVKFDEYGRVKAVTAEIVTNRAFSFNFDTMREIDDELRLFVDKWSGETHPTGLRNGWASTFLAFYDTQDNLFKGTLTAMGVSLCLAFAVLFLTTFNIVTSFYAILSIGFILLCTVGTVVLLGWELNILESVTVSTAVGLAVDFTVHLSVTYRLCRLSNRKDRTLYAVHQMGPAITMAALTTFAAGVMMMPATILTFFQTGVFLMLIMSFSWFYANFFFLPLCAIIGPEGRFGQVPVPRIVDCYDSSAVDDNAKESSPVVLTYTSKYEIVSAAVEATPRSLSSKKFDLDDFGEGCFV